MVQAMFSAKCPLEIGDTVFVKDKENNESIRQAYYIPKGAAVIFKGPTERHKITDICTLNYLKSGEVQFIYEMDNSGKYEPLKVKVPITEFAELLKQK